MSVFATTDCYVIDNRNHVTCLRKIVNLLLLKQMVDVFIHVLYTAQA